MDIKSKSADIKAPFRELSKTATQLNFVSDALGKFVLEAESGLKTLNLGVSAWVKVTISGSDDGLVTYYEELGYDRVGKNWCIALRTYRDAEWSETSFDYEAWPFNEGPRELRIKAVDHLPALLQKLNTEATKLAKRVTDVLPRANQVASDISGLVGEAKNESQQGKTR